MPSKQAKAPISAHPLFPAVVALWFAALFGLGSAVLPDSLFEHAIALTHLAALIPVAAPPLGATFHLFLSPAFALLGAALGFVLARRLASTQAYAANSALAGSRIVPRRDSAEPGDGKRRPLSVKEELGDAQLDPIVDDRDNARSLPIPRRRRSLALSEDEHTREFFAPEQAAGPSPEMTPGRIDPALEDGTPVVAGSEAGEVASAAEFAAADRGLDGLRNPLFSRPLGDEDDEPVEFEPPASPRAFSEALPAGEAEADPPAQVRAGSQQQPARSAALRTPMLPTDPEVDLDDLGMVQLAERLAASLRTRLIRPVATPELIARLKADFEIEIGAQFASENSAVAPGSAIFGGAGFGSAAPAPAALPEALRPLPTEFDEENEEDEDGLTLPSLALPLGQRARPQMEDPADGEDELDDIGDAEENYSSLLAMRGPFHASAPAGAAIPAEADARPFDAPAGISEPARADPEETDRALRSALAALQRMSGTA
ncbi:MAG: hypothetical protein J7496_06875 [Novosphingobium sp.]|nr:hypothetical protein [Novosphingobium sp.]MBO9602215.1 hypothetical protein [Novosphingobium sp.]